MLAELATTVADSLERAYTPTVERASRRVGLHGLFVRLYDGIWRALISVGYLLSDDTKDVSVGDAAADFHVSSRSEYERASTLIGEQEVVAELLADATGADTFWDVGANVGLYACLLADVLPDRNVVAFEPHPGNATRLRRNLKLNNRQVRIDERALSDADGTAELRIVGDDAGAGAHTLKGSTDAAQTVKVTLARGDTLVATGEYEAPTLVKIDVEGAELGVLQGMTETLSEDACRIVYVEVHRDHGVDVADVCDLLTGVGFDVALIQERGSTTFLRARKASLTGKVAGVHEPERPGRGRHRSGP